MMNLTQHLSTIYQRIRKNCCEEWLKDCRNFYQWYENQLKKQNWRCIYCGLSGNTKKHYQRWFRGGRRGRSLEVDRIDSGKPYSPENCVLACYPCNNAKSDVFSYEDFLEIGKAIHRVKIRLDELRA